MRSKRKRADAGRASAADPDRPPALVNAGLIHGAGGGAFITGDLCPSHNPLDRAFIEEVAAQGPGTPLTLAVSGGWIAHHTRFRLAAGESAGGRDRHYLGGSLLVPSLHAGTEGRAELSPAPRRRSRPRDFRDRENPHRPRRDAVRLLPLSRARGGWRAAGETEGAPSRGARRG